ncbi:unnamed protein product [Pleuronectes platessa]|uniref:Uncharacterized protein n=1 Tax=Pleuronectes platessa TaxID=8262 RepID=A0A9N7Z9L6_PLEPL|nr:unnamed protein product [Pleuronectes platessa]
MVVQSGALGEEEEEEEDNTTRDGRRYKIKPPLHSVAAGEGEQGVGAAPVSLQRRADVGEISPAVMTRLAAPLADTPGCGFPCRAPGPGCVCVCVSSLVPCCVSLGTVGGCCSSTVHGTHSTPRSALPTALHHSNRSSGRARSRETHTHPSCLPPARARGPPASPRAACPPPAVRPQSCCCCCWETHSAVYCVMVPKN